RARPQSRQNTPDWVVVTPMTTKATTLRSVTCVAGVPPQILHAFGDTATGTREGTHSVPFQNHWPSGEYWPSRCTCGTAAGNWAACVMSARVADAGMSAPAFGLSTLIPPLTWPAVRQIVRPDRENADRIIRSRFEPIANGCHPRRRSRHPDAVTHSQGASSHLRPAHDRLGPGRGDGGRREGRQGDRQPAPGRAGGSP